MRIYNGLGLTNLYLELVVWRRDFLWPQHCRAIYPLSTLETIWMCKTALKLHMWEKVLHDITRSQFSIAHTVWYVLCSVRSSYLIFTQQVLGSSIQHTPTTSPMKHGWSKGLLDLQNHVTNYVAICHKCKLREHHNTHSAQLWIAMIVKLTRNHNQSKYCPRVGKCFSTELGICGFCDIH